jgi:hypothetical protein
MESNCRLPLNLIFVFPFTCSFNPNRSFSILFSALESGRSFRIHEAWPFGDEDSL